MSQVDEIIHAKGQREGTFEDLGWRPVGASHEEPYMHTFGT